MEFNDKIPIGIKITVGDIKTNISSNTYKAK
jgi:hypothetical protein